MKKIIFLLAVMLCVMTAVGHAEDIDIEFSLPSGFYLQPEEIAIICSDPEATIYYTLDGTVPDENSYVYSSEMLLTWSNDREDELSQLLLIGNGSDYVPIMDFPTGHVLRAVAITADGESSPVISATYMIGYDREALYGDTAIMFLVTDPANLLDYETGIYVRGAIYDAYLAEVEAGNTDAVADYNYNMRGREGERPVSVTYLPANDEGFTLDMGMRIKGKGSRARDQKSLRLIAREEYGEKNIKYEIYEDNVREYDGKSVTKYKSLTLRNGGFDIQYSRVRDPLHSHLATGLRMTTAENIACIAFINGEYWGIYSLNEEYSDNFIQYHYDVDNDNVIIVKCGEIEEGEEEDIKFYQELHDYIVEHDMTQPDCYAWVEERLDIASFIDYWAFNFYISNDDWAYTNNNWQMWRVREIDEDGYDYEDGRWRIMLYDTDNAAGLYDEENEALADNITLLLSPKENVWWRSPHKMFVALMENESFANDLIRAMCDIRHFYCTVERASAKVEEMREDYAPYMADTQRRFGPNNIAANPEGRTDKYMDLLIRFYVLRYDAFLPIVQNVFGLSQPCAITVQVTDDTKGAVYFNGRTIPAQNGGAYEYFMECGVTVTAEPAKGATFTGWTVIQGEATLADPSALTTAIEFEGPFTLLANFE